MSHQYTPQQEQPLIAHLIELRARILRIVCCIGLVFLVLMPFANALYEMLAEPLLKFLPAGGTMIATEVAAPFFAPFKLAAVVAFLIALPYVLYQFWAFIAPGLYKNERRIALPLLVSGVLLFYGGMAFAYFVVFPLVFEFLISSAPIGVAVMTDISKYLDFVLKMFLAFGLAFEVPIATITLVWAGLTTPERLVAKRPYVIVGCFVIGMLLTPPDAISQTLLAVPMWLLFEAGVLIARIIVPTRDAAQDVDDASS